MSVHSVDLLIIHIAVQVLGRLFRIEIVKGLLLVPLIFRFRLIHIGLKLVNLSFFHLLVELGSVPLLLNWWRFFDYLLFGKAMFLNILENINYTLLGLGFCFSLLSFFFIFLAGSSLLLHHLFKVVFTTFLAFIHFRLHITYSCYDKIFFVCV